MRSEKDFLYSLNNLAKAKYYGVVDAAIEQRLEQIEENKYLRFIHTLNKPKTMVWVVQSTHDSTNLGIIEWYPSWRQYCFFSDRDEIWSEDCLRVLQYFLEKINNNKKAITKAILQRREWDE